MTVRTSTEDKLREIELLEKKIKMREGLPHLYGMPWYSWAWDFFQSTNTYNFLCAANQISKSSTQIRKCIEWGTNQKLWAKLWRKRPLQFWYLYPTREVATIEFEKKWVEEFLPKGIYKDHPVYGWRAEYKNKFIWALHFNSGVSVYFKTYATDVSHLQSGSVDAIFCDEELPEDLFDELNMRIAATDGYFHMVFTATLGQEFWRETIEETGVNERFKDAFKRQVSMYDCLTYRDGSLSPWTKEKITRIINSCKSKAEVLRRVFGRFVVDQGLKYPSFDREKNVKPWHFLPSHWLIFAGIDPGSGGDKGHPAAISFVGVSPDFKKGRVFKGWRGDGVLTTAGDVLMKFQSMSEGLTVTAAYYDWADKDFGTIAQRTGISVLPADKSHDRGEKILNVLFKNDILQIYDLDELKPLVSELSTLQRDTPKTKAKDDYSDSLRYACTLIPWDWSVIQGAFEIMTPEKTDKERELEERRKAFSDHDDSEFFQDVEEELAAWGELYEN